MANTRNARFIKMPKERSQNEIEVAVYCRSINSDLSVIVQANSRLGDELEAAKNLCEIYFKIAVNAIGEKEVRRLRDEMIANKN